MNHEMELSMENKIWEIENGPLKFDEMKVKMKENEEENETILVNKVENFEDAKVNIESRLKGYTKCKVIG